MTISIKANEIADKWGPALTKAILDGDLSAFKDLFVSEPVAVVLQNGEGAEAEFTIGDGEEATLTWGEFHELTTKDLKEQSFLKSESQCLGVLGDRMIMEVGRFNKDGEVYAEAYSLLTFNEEGKIVAVEAFSDPVVGSLMSAVSSK
jgi:ketosteroid isomerase-like protein